MMGKNLKKIKTGTGKETEKNNSSKNKRRKIDKERVAAWTACFLAVACLLALWKIELDKLAEQEKKIKSQIAIFDQKKSDAFLEVAYLEVGKGDTIFLNYADKYQILIDGSAGKNQPSYYLPLLMPEGDRELELVMVTHAHRDHFIGITKVLQKFKVKRFITNGETFGGEEFAAGIEKQDIELESFKKGDTIKIDEILTLNFLGPSDETRKAFDSDNNSLVMKFIFGKNRFLFLGDAKLDAEKEFLRNNANLGADFLKVGHHGYDDASSEEFLQAVAPKYAFITPGKDIELTNTTVEKLQKMNVETFRLEEVGTVRVECTSLQSECQILK